jgi:5-methylcytosine-specific restriction endonuclease McrA
MSRPPTLTPEEALLRRRANSKRWREAHKGSESARHKAYNATHHAQHNAARQARRDANRQREQEKDRAYRAKNAEREKARHAANYQVNKTRKKVYAQAYYEANKEQIIAKTTQWSKQNRPKRREMEKRYVERHPDVIKAKKHTDYARRSGAPIRDLTRQQWLDIQTAQDHCCAYCGKRAKGHLTQDHITPISSGGNHTLHNIIAACRNCNSRKGNRAILSPVQPLLL